MIIPNIWRNKTCLKPPTIYIYIILYIYYIYPRSPKDIFYKGHFPEFKVLAIHAHPWVAPLLLMPQSATMTNFIEINIEEALKPKITNSCQGSIPASCQGDKITGFPAKTVSFE
jgi:hypothetical protein